MVGILINFLLTKGLFSGAKISVSGRCTLFGWVFCDKANGKKPPWTIYICPSKDGRWTLAINSIVTMAWQMRNCFRKQIGGCASFDFADIISQHIHGALSSVTQGLLGSSDDSRESLLGSEDNWCGQLKQLSPLQWDEVRNRSWRTKKRLGHLHCWWGDHVQRRKWTLVAGDCFFWSGGSLKIINDEELLVNEQTKGDDEESVTRALNHLDQHGQAAWCLRGCCAFRDMTWGFSHQVYSGQNHCGMKAGLWMARLSERGARWLWALGKLHHCTNGWMGQNRTHGAGSRSAVVLIQLKDLFINR